MFLPEMGTAVMAIRMEAQAMRAILDAQDNAKEKVANDDNDNDNNNDGAENAATGAGHEKPDTPPKLLAKKS